MNFQLVYTFIYLIAFLGIIQICELLYYKFNVNAEITRKIAHIIGSLSSLSFLLLFQSHWYVLIIGLAFFILLLFSKQKGIYSSIDYIERKSTGSYLLPIAIYFQYLIYELANDKIYFILPILILGISDPLAGLVGTSCKKAKKIKIFSFTFQKTYAGSIAFFISTFVLTISIISIYSFSDQNILLLGLCFAFTLTFIEMISNRGLDNLTVPLLTALLIWIVK